MSRIVACALVAVYVLVAAGALAAERPLTEAPPMGPAFGFQDPISIAFNPAGEGFVTWNDARGGDHTMEYGSRVDARGHLLDPEGLRSVPPIVVWTGNGWLGFRGSAALRMRADGAVEHRGEVQFGPTGRRGVASNGRSIVVLHNSPDFHSIGIVNADLTGYRNLTHGRQIVNPYAVVTDGNDYYVFGYGYEHRSPFHSPSTIVKISSAGDVISRVETGMIGNLDAVVWSGTDLVAVASGDQPPAVFRFRADLTSKGPPIPLPVPQGNFKTLASGGNGQVLAIWTDGSDLKAADIHESSAGAPFKLGTIAGPGHVSIEEIGLPWGQFRAASTSRDYVIVAGDLRTTTLPIDPALRPPSVTWTLEQTTSPAAQHQFAPVRNGLSGLFTFVQQDGLSSRVMIGRAGIEPVPLLASSNRQFSPSITSSGRTALVTWMEERTGEWASTLLGMIVDMSGRPLLRQALLLDPGVSHNGSFAWSGNDRFIWPAGAAWTGSLYLVSWGGRIARVLESGALLQAGPQQVHRAGADHVTLARVGDIVVAVWMEGDCLRHNMFECWPTTLHAARFTLNGEPIDGTAIDLAPGQGPYGLPQIAVNGNEALIAADPGLIIRFRSDGTFDPPVWLGNGLYSAYRLSIANHGDGFIMAWNPSLFHRDVQAATLSRELQQSARMLLASDSAQTQGPQVWTTATGEAAVVYIRVGAHTDHVPRLYVRTPGDPESTRRRAVRR